MTEHTPENQLSSFQLPSLAFLFFFLHLSALSHLAASSRAGGEGRVIAWFTANTCLSVLPQCLTQMFFFPLPPLLPFGPLVSVPQADFHHPIRNNTVFSLPFLWEP